MRAAVQPFCSPFAAGLRLLSVGGWAALVLSALSIHGWCACQCLGWLAARGAHLTLWTQTDPACDLCYLSLSFPLFS